MTTKVKKLNFGELVSHTGQRQQLHDDAVPQAVRRESGHFGTPPSLATFMAQMATIPSGSIRILDPGAGVGTLTAALCDRIARLRTPRQVYLEMWENDPILESHLKETADEICSVLEDRGHKAEAVVRTDDFIIANTSTLLTTVSPGDFNISIMNPPYFKLKKESDHARAMSHVVHGQPNIYALFMAKGAELLNDDGQLIAITPRSYFNGPYFKLFRKWFLDRMTPNQIHVFESRKDAFRNDDVLQENIILSARKKSSFNGKATPPEVAATNGANVHFVNVTSSHGRDTSEKSTDRQLSLSQVVSGPDKVIRVTTNDFDQQLIDRIERLPQRFADSGLSISTGPVVTFRATEYLLQGRENDVDSAPLLMMHNIRPFETILSVKSGKPSHIRVSASSLKLLVPADRYVLIKRFTSKEEKRRLVAGIVEKKHSYSEWLGLENHVNYVHKNGRGLSEAEAFGLAALFNSLALDTYLRAISGNTQVNATEVRALCLPSISEIEKLGKAVRNLPQMEAGHVEKLVAKSLGLTSSMTKQLMENS